MRLNISLSGLTLITVRRRVAAYAKTHSVNLSNIPFDFISAPPSLMEENDTSNLSIAVNCADIIVIDTLARSMPGGDESAAKDIAVILENCKMLHAETKAMIILVHHSGKDQTKGPRGSSSLFAAADAVIEIKNQSVTKTATVTKLKDGEDGKTYTFNLIPVTLGIDEDNEPITSCTIELLGCSAKKTQDEPRLGKWQEEVLDVLNKQSTISKEDLISKILFRNTINEYQGKRDQRRTSISRTIDNLLSKGEIEIIDDQISLTKTTSFQKRLQS